MRFNLREENEDSASFDFEVDSVVYNTRTNTIGIVRLSNERGETKTDADGNVNTSELEPYNPMKYPHQKNAEVAPSTKKEIENRGLWKPFATALSKFKKEESTMRFNIREENEEALKSAINGACKKYCYASAKPAPKTCKDYCYAKSGTSMEDVYKKFQKSSTRESVLESIIRRIVKNELRRKY